MIPTNTRFIPTICDGEGLTRNEHAKTVLLYCSVRTGTQSYCPVFYCCIVFHVEKIVSYDRYVKSTVLYCTVDCFSSMRNSKFKN